MTDVCYTLVHSPGNDQPTVQELMAQLEKGTDDSKIQTMHTILQIILNGDPLPQLLMHIIRFVMPSKNKELKKLLYFYYEICPKTNPDGRLKQEMILVCNGIQHDLQHPNEFVRGSTLRFLCKLREAELLEPLTPYTRTCLEHRHAYVRKNAILAVWAIYEHHDALIPDAPDLIEVFLQDESDWTCKRNAFVALTSIAPDRAIAYVNATIDAIPSADELFQLVIIQFVRKDAIFNSPNKARYLKLVLDLLDSTSRVVVYEAASALTSLTTSSVAIKAAASKLIDLCIKEPDNNVKIIVLEQLEQLRQKHAGILEELTMEILRVLSSTDIYVRKMALDIALEMISSRNIDEVIQLLKKELARSLDQDFEKATEYRQLLIHTIHLCSIKFSKVASGVVDLLLDFLSESNSASATDVLQFTKEVVERFPDLRSHIISKLLDTLQTVKSGKIIRGTLWIIGEYCTDEKDVRNAWKAIRSSLGEVPIVGSEQKRRHEKVQEEKDSGTEGKPHATASRKVLPDGTYATETALTSNSIQNSSEDSSRPPLRAAILNGDFYVANVLASTLTKLVARYAELSSSEARVNALKSEAMLIMVSVIRAGQSEFVKQPIEEDSVDRIMSCFKSLAEAKNPSEIAKIFLDDTQSALKAMIAAEDKKRAQDDAVQREKNAIQVDDLISIRQLAKISPSESNGQGDDDLASALQSTSKTLPASQLDKIVQLTGFSDPIYAEAYVKVHQFDIVLDVLLVNQTTETLQNLSVEFATLGDLKVVERSGSHSLGPHGFHSAQSTIKVSSTDTGVIFGNIVYGGASATDTNIVILNDVHVDVMDYIKPAKCTEAQFRSMWTEFEWENKVNISSNLPSLREYLDQLLKNTNMLCLTPEASLTGDCQFLSANLYARSVFGEDALANLSIEKEGNGPVTGHVRIRSKGQGLALSLGDRIASGEKKFKN